MRNRGTCFGWRAFYGKLQHNFYSFLFFFNLFSLISNDSEKFQCIQCIQHALSLNQKKLKALKICWRSGKSLNICRLKCHLHNIVRNFSIWTFWILNGRFSTSASHRARPSAVKKPSNFRTIFGKFKHLIYMKTVEIHKINFMNFDVIFVFIRGW